MKVIHPSFADPRGGAGRAAHRIHGALVKAGVDSIMVVNEKITDDNRGVAEPASLCQLRTILRRAFAGAVLKLAGLSSAVGMHSLGLLPSRWVSFASNSGADVIHRHWVSAEYISIKDVSLLEEPLCSSLRRSLMRLAATVVNAPCLSVPIQSSVGGWTHRCKGLLETR